MSRKRREVMEQADKTPKNAVQTSSSEQRSWWRNLTGTQRWFAIGMIAFLAIGALGAGLKYLEDFAQKQKADPQSQSLLAGVNPFTTAPVPPVTPTPLPLSKQYIYAGSRLLAVKDAGVDVAAPSDLAVWRPSSGYWYVMGSQITIQAWGMENDIPAPGDFDGDGKTDFCIYRPSEGNWYIMRSSDGGYYVTTFGTSEDRVAQADYDGDGKTDIALFRPSNKYWYIMQSSDSQTVIDSLDEKDGDPYPADYDGDGKSDMAIWRNSEANFRVLFSSTRKYILTPFGETDDLPVIGDYDGDGRADLATWRGADNIWRILQSSNNQMLSIPWGVQSTDIAVPSDYDSDGKCDLAVWRSTGALTGYWFISQSSNGQPRTDQFGIAGDIPVPSRYRR